MERHGGRVERLSHFLHKNLLWLLLGSYAVAAAWPGPGLKARNVSVGRVAFFHEQVNLTLPVLTLAALLLNAGLGVRVSQLRGLARRPAALLSGLAANLLIPIAYILGVSLAMDAWHNPDEVQNILVGLALIASMPIAGSSTAWSQNADGDLALSLGLVLGSTLLSPLTTPLALYAVGFMARGDYAEDLHELAAGGAGAFLALGVILPSFLGIALRSAVGERRIAAAKPALRPINTGVLLFLNYSNASAALPQAIARPDPDFLAATLAIVVGLCALMFAAGWALARSVRAGRERRVSLMFGLGMNNNGSGLVMASLALADHPRVLLPIIFYNLVQHLVAGAADRILERGRAVDDDVEPGVSPGCLPDLSSAIPRAARVKADRRAAHDR
ncbi:MAG: bile acid:sodium symporter [Planctomycetaceae bacterium]|nr:bile acid:sodium symporter [Planctomycetaceae bacterium]